MRRKWYNLPMTLTEKIIAPLPPRVRGFILRNLPQRKAVAGFLTGLAYTALAALDVTELDPQVDALITALASSTAFYLVPASGRTPAEKKAVDKARAEEVIDKIHAYDPRGRESASKRR